MSSNLVGLLVSLGLATVPPVSTVPTVPTVPPVAKIDALVKAYADQGKFSGAILVADHGKVIYRKGFGWANAEWKIPNGPATKFRIGSITKQFTAMMVLQLVEEKKLKLDGTIGDYLPEWPAGAGRAITIHQLLTHTSGIHNYTDLPRFFPELSRDPYKPVDLLGMFDSLPLDFAPGSSWSYSNSGYITLGVLIERAGGKPYDEQLRERILQPLGLKDTGYDWGATVLPNRAEGYTRGFDGDEHANYIDMSTPYSAGAMYSTVDDLYRWQQALTARKLLSAESYAIYLTGQVTTGRSKYGYGLSFTKVARRQGQDSAVAIGHNGGINGFASASTMIPEDGVSIIWLDNTAQGSPLIPGILAILYGRTPRQPIPSVARTLYPIILRQGADSAVARYRQWKQLSPEAYDFSEGEVNLLGYHLLKRGQASAAVQILRLNAEAYPGSSNAYDSLAEALLAAGDTIQAVANYRRSLELDGNNRNAADLLKRLGGR